MSGAAGAPRLGRSAWAVFAGIVTIFVLSLAVDQVFHVLDVYPPWGQPMREPGLNALALGYRLPINVLGCWLIARLAPRAPLKHALIGGAIGLVLSLLGIVAAVKQDLGPLWYPVLLAASALPCAWLGGTLRSRAMTR